MTAWLLDGVEIDLTRTQIDVYGGRWTWTGTRTETDEPLMQCGDDAPLPLSEVYATYGPLIAAPAPITHADRYAAITACPAEPTTAPTPSSFAALVGRLRRRAA
ncbi:phiSA1p31-related protein [Streptomyces sp. DH8]|uniref:phiSA1p31-related protein n=1 Tax=Streptomyces sp. DH8 TaxID=2857008 RepID=UPI001E62B31D|nr:phiSA1p31-related protein [Streptomyces sp. DH8]